MRTPILATATAVLALAACTRSPPVTIDKVASVEAALQFTAAMNEGDALVVEPLLSATSASVQWPGFWETVRLRGSEAGPGSSPAGLSGYLGYATALGAHTSLASCSAFPGGSAAWADVWVDCRFSYRDALSDLGGTPISGAIVFGLADGTVSSVQVVPPTGLASLGLRDWLAAQRPDAYRRLLTPAGVSVDANPPARGRPAPDLSPVYTPGSARELLDLARRYYEVPY